MRDLRQDLEDYHRYMAERSLKVIDLMVDSLPHAIDRALRGENFIKGLNKELADAQDQKSRAEAEVAKYKRALELACEKLDELDGCYFIPGGDSLDTVYLKMAKAEDGE